MEFLVSGDQIDIATLQFSMPIWLSLPAKVKKLGVIRSVISGIHDNSGTIKDLDIGLLYGNRVSITPNQYGIILLNGQVQLIDSADAVNSAPTVVSASSVGPRPDWESLINNWGKLTPLGKATIANGTSQLRVSTTSEIDGAEVIGTIALHPSSKDILLFTVDTDTIPTNTLDPIDAIVDPSKKGPGTGLNASADGQRYLIISDIGATGNVDGADAWKGSGGDVTLHESLTTRHLQSTLTAAELSIIPKTENLNSECYSVIPKPLEGKRRSLMM